MTAATLRLGPAAARPGEDPAGWPVRLPLGRAALELLAARAGVRLPWQRPDVAGTAALARRLSGQAEEPSEAAAVRELVRLGAADARGVVRPAVLAALTVFGRATVVVDVDLARRTSTGPVTLRSWHRRCGDRVTWLTVVGDRGELGWCDRARWPGQLTATAAGGPDTPAGLGPRPGLTLPLPLVLATGEALTADRRDLLAELLRHPDVAGEAEQLRLLHGAVRARLQATVAGHGPAGGDRRLGLVGWLRYDDGWRSLTPVTRAGRPWVRLDRVAPSLLAAEVARLERRLAC